MNRKQWMMAGTALIRAADLVPVEDIPAYALFASNRDRRFFEYMKAKGVLHGQAERKGA